VACATATASATATATQPAYDQSPGYHQPYLSEAPQLLQPALVAFVPNAMGARLDPRRFKFAPRAAMGSVMPAGMRSVRRDNFMCGNALAVG